MKAGEALRAAAARLAAASETPRLDAELLLAHALGMAREALLLRGLDMEAPPGFEALVARRLRHEPIAYITGHKAFWTLDLAVTPDVLIPRPDSETLIEAAIDHFGGRTPARVLDLGTGSGALLLAALAHWPAATGPGVDRSQPAIAVARANARRTGLSGRATFTCGGWTTGGDVPFDLVLCNPPYIGAGEALPPSVAGYEPGAALFAGGDGLDDYRMIAPVLRLAPDGVACIEIGAAQAAAAGALFRDEGFAVAVRQDIAGRDRCLVATGGR